ncbi:MAG: hypothetical protein U0V70_08755 [Terriglobia bacterium]
MKAQFVYYFLTLAGLVLLPLSVTGQKYAGRRVWVLKNEKMEVMIAPGGGHIASATLTSGRGAGLNPFWQPKWKSIEPAEWKSSLKDYGDPPEARLLASILGHNICLDFFGSVSPAETAAGITVHGEAPIQTWKETATTGSSLTYGAALTKAQLKVTRQTALTPNSSVLWIVESVENLGDFDRPIGWQQHPTIGRPFLEKGASFFDAPATWCKTGPGSFSKGLRLKSGTEFQWPNAPGADGKTVNLREWPQGDKSSDFIATLMDPSREWAYFTAINRNKGLLIGYIWPRKEWPWLGIWEENLFRSAKPWEQREVTRGLEFGTTAFPEGRRAAIEMAQLHGVPTYRWIGAHETQTISYGLFLAPIPEGTTGVSDVQIVGDSIVIQLTGVKETIKLALKRP